MQRLEAVEDEEAAPLAHDAGEALAFLERAGAACGEFFVRVVAGEGEGFLEEQVGGSGQLLARALAVERPRKGGVAARPVLMREVGGPLGDEGGFAFAAEGDEGEDVGTFLFATHDLIPRVAEELEFGFAPDEFRRGVFEDAGDVGLEATWGAGLLAHRRAPVGFR
ncbi:MAG: hypothetical protein HYY24_24435 [Verrucomicrobia bacterium]|nr:hypothetical protein [Verrucomicrobiota bacterium]